MNRLLENIFANRQKSVLRNNIDISLSPERLIQRINESQNALMSNIKDNPIEVSEPSWERFQDYEKEFFKKTFNFSDMKLLKYFLNETLNISEKTQHYPGINIEDKTVSIILYTKGIDEITDVDVEMAKSIDMIIDDINSFQLTQ
jgi:pterin-4a-carbinolamine dehydratase